MGQTIANIELLDNRPKGMLRVRLGYNNTIVYVVSRDDLKKIRDYTDINSPGIYFLVGPSDSDSDESSPESDFQYEVYVGQSTVRQKGKSFTERLREHFNDERMDFFTHVILAFDNNPNFKMDESALNYAEHCLIEAASRARRYKSRNGNGGKTYNTGQDDIDYLDDYFLPEVKTILTLLGYDFLETAVDADTSTEAGSGSEKLVLSGRNFEASGRRVPEGFVVYRGAELGPILQTQSGKKYYKKIKRLRDRFGVIGEGKLKEDCLFDSPTQAAEFVGGFHMSGPNRWRSESTGKPLSELDSELVDFG